jgi:hypothetical protein
MEGLTTTERRRRAIKAATQIAAAFDVKSQEPVVLKDSNNTVIHLTPSPVVAKVATATLTRKTLSNLEHELKVALHLVELEAPIVPPSREIPPATYWSDDLEITFWQYCPGKVRENVDHPELAAALQQFHAALASYNGALKPFTEDYAVCNSLLDSDRLSPELARDDRQFLRQVYEHLSASLQDLDYERVPVHTEIHGGNILWTKRKPLLIDFESCSRGPRELDFLFFSEKNLSACPELNKQLMDILSQLRSFRVAVWCWSQPDRAPEVREAAEYHLSRLHDLN